MKKIVHSIIVLLSAVVMLTGCAGISYLNIETYEPAQVTLPVPIKSILVANNVVQQPDDVGHDIKKLGTRSYERTKASSDSIAIYYTEALAQFLDEEEYFDSVKYYNDPLRKDNGFWQEFPILPEKMIEMRQATGTNAIVSLDKLLIETKWTDYYQMEGYRYANLVAKINSIIRVYMPSMDGVIPAIQFTDSLTWEGYAIRDSRAYAENIIPSTEEAMKELVVYAAEKMTKVFAPYWESQSRWYYTSMSSTMREGEIYARNNQWEEALEKWNEQYHKDNKKLNRAKAAHNIALSHEMLGDMDSAEIWANVAFDLFEQSTSKSSLDMRRALIYKTEITRRIEYGKKLEKQLEEQRGF